jgi:hypothetical protein
MHLGATAMSPEVMSAFSFAHPFLEACRRCCHGRLDAPLAEHDRRSKALEKAKKKDKAYYEGQMKSCSSISWKCVMPVTMGKMDAIMANLRCGRRNFRQDAFGGK